MWCGKNGGVSMITLRVFSNWELILVIMPSAATKDSRDSTCSRMPPRTMCWNGARLVCCFHSNVVSLSGALGK